MDNTFYKICQLVGRFKIHVFKHISIVGLYLRIEVIGVDAIRIIAHSFNLDVILVHLKDAVTRRNYEFLSL